MTEFRFVYITTETEADALALGRVLVGERLAACINVLPPIKSVYWWHEKVAEGQEVALIAKTRAALMPALTERVKAWHPYDCPCIVSLPIAANEGNGDFLQWIAEETAAAKQGGA